ncbi:MAG: DUF2189 domain-containing protein [Siculibacillus sp.]|nr:DUF2189 domain-containing protein [Siculibacillus sp.]
MSDVNAMSGDPGRSAEAAAEHLRRQPKVRNIDGRDIAAAFASGLADFRAAPLFGLFFGGFYAVGGLFLVWLTFWTGLGYLTYPFAAGFALLGPFVAVGCYEVSRRREAGIALDWRGVIGVVFDQSRREVGWMAFVTLFIFIIWMYQIRMLLVLCLGFKSFVTVHEFVQVVTSTPEGWIFLGIGHLDGAILSLVAFTLTVVSFPLLLDRDVDFITAMITSVKAVFVNPKTMIVWAAIVTGLMVLAVLPAFLGLFVVLPVLGHTTWHLYRRVVEPPQV